MSTVAKGQEKSAGGGQAALDFLSSVKLTVVLLIGLAATSIVGTLIPQNEAPEAYIQAYGQAKYELYHSLQITDMYHSWLFVGMLALLITNLLVCSIRRFPMTLKAISPPDYKIDEGFFAKQHEHESFHTKLTPAEAAAKAAPLIRAGFSAKAAPLGLLALVAGLVGVFAGLIISNDQTAVFISVAVCEAVVIGVELLRRARVPLPRVLPGDEGATVVAAEKGHLTRLGFYIVHTSIILVVTGAIMGSFWGVRGSIRIPEGQTLDYFWVRATKQKVQLPFGVRLNKFSVTFYPTGMPKEYKSILSVIDNGKVVETRPVVVNSPLSYKGWRFYQSDYQAMGLNSLSLSVQPRSGGAPSVLDMPGFNRPVPLSGGGTVQVVDFQEDLVDMGPALRLHVEHPGQPSADFWVFDRLRDFDRDRGGNEIFSVQNMGMQYASGLEVSRDPGVWVVWGGCILMVMGFLVAFFMSHRRLWLRAAPKGGKTLVQVAGRTNKNRPGFENEFAALLATLKEELK